MAATGKGKSIRDLIEITSIIGLWVVVAVNGSILGSSSGSMSLKIVTLNADNRSNLRLNWYKT